MWLASSHKCHDSMNDRMRLHQHIEQTAQRDHPLSSGSHPAAIQCQQLLIGLFISARAASNATHVCVQARGPVVLRSLQTSTQM